MHRSRSRAAIPISTAISHPSIPRDDFADLKITGEIPKDLAGAFFRNGPNPQFAPRDDFHHWFAGDGMIHGVYVENGKARYRNRYVPHAQMGDRKQGGTRALRHVRQSDDQRSVDPGEGQRRRQHQHRLAWRQAAGAGRSAPTLRARSAQRLESKGYLDYAGTAARFHRPSQDRSGDGRAGVLRLRRGRGLFRPKRYCTARQTRPERSRGSTVSRRRSAP